MVNLIFEKTEMVTTGGRGEVTSKTEKISGMVADVPTTDSLRKRCGEFGGWEMAAGKVEVLLVVSGVDVDRNSDA